MRMVSSDYGQCIVDAGHEVCPADGSVHFHSFMQSLLGLAVMVSVVDTPSWQRRKYFQSAVRLLNATYLTSYKNHRLQNSTIKKVWGCSFTSFQTVFNDPTSTLDCPFYSHPVWLNNRCHTCRCWPSTAIDCNCASLTRLSQGHRPSSACYI